MLGLAEAGFFPGIIVYLTHWFAPADRARAMSGLILAIPFALGLGAPIWPPFSRSIGSAYRAGTGSSILEGLPAVALGIFTLFYLTDRPKHAHWLETNEHNWILNALETERLGKQASEHITVFQAFRQRNVILLALLFSANLNSYTFVFWLPTVIKQASGLSDTAATLFSGLPYVAGLIAMLVASYLSDRSGRRKFYAIIPLIVTAVFLMLSGAARTAVLAGHALAVPGRRRHLRGRPSFWVLPTMTLQAAAAAASIGMINAIANVSGFIAPSIVGKLLDRGFSHSQIVPYLACCPLVAALLIAALRVPTPSRREPAGATPSEKTLSEA